MGTAAVSLAAMMTEARRRSNQETTSGASSNQFVSDEEVRSLLNTYLAELYDLLVENKGDDYYRTPYPFSTSANQASYALPFDFYRLLSVDLAWGSNIVRSARRFTEAERNRYKSFPAWNYTAPVWYQLQAGNIVFIPTPGSAIIITLNYVPAFTPFATDGSQDENTFDGINGWHDFAVWGAAAAMRAKGRMDPSYQLGQQQVWRSRILALAATRDMGDAPRVQRMRGRAWENE